MTVLLGALVVGGGAYKAFDLAQNAEAILKNNVTWKGANDTKSKQIARVIGNALRLLARFSALLGVALFGMHLIKVGAGIGILSVVETGAAKALPILATAFGSLVAGEVTYRLGS